MTSLWASFLLPSRHALADDSPTQKVQTAQAASTSDAESKTSTASAPATASPEQLAAIAYQEARANYAKGDVAAALNSMRESYRLSKRPELLYNVAQLEDELKACSDSLADYRRYLELVPHGRYRDSAEQACQRLERECPPPAASLAAAAAANSAATTKEEQQAPLAEPSPYWTTPRIIGWSTIAAGTLSGATALYFQMKAVQARDDLQQSVDRAEAGGPPVDMSLQDQMHRYNHVAIGLGITSGALVAGGALLLLLDPGNPGQPRRSASLYALPGLFGASYAQRF